MCLGEVARVREVSATGVLVVESADRTSTVSGLLLDRAVEVGDWVLTHSGYALAVLTEHEAAEALSVRKSMDAERA